MEESERILFLSPPSTRRKSYECGKIEGRILLLLPPFAAAAAAAAAATDDGSGRAGGRALLPLSSHSLTKEGRTCWPLLQPFYVPHTRTAFAAFPLSSFSLSLLKEREIER